MLPLFFEEQKRTSGRLNAKLVLYSFTMPFLYGKGEIYGSIFFCKDLSLKYGKIIISMRIISSYFDGENILLHSEFFLFFLLFC